MIPDAWFRLCAAGEAPVSIALELDRGTEDQMVWRQKVAALAVWAIGPYRKAFATDNLTIAVVCPDVARRDVLAGWTMRELEARGHRELADIFLFTRSQFPQVLLSSSSGHLVPASSPRSCTAS